jgi:hypothetical protein
MNEVAKVEEKQITQTQVTMMQMLQQVIEKGQGLDYFKQVMDLKDRYEAGEAKKAYVSAMAEFKKIAPKIIKDKKNGQFDSWYSSISEIVNKATPALAEHGLSMRWDYPDSSDKNLIRVVCILTHCLGHSESVSAESPIDDSGKKNAVQQRKSTRTYLKIETFEAITGLVSEENNISDDGNSSSKKNEKPETPKDKLTIEQQKTMCDIISDKKTDQELEEYYTECKDTIEPDSLVSLTMAYNKKKVSVILKEVEAFKNDTKLAVYYKELKARYADDQESWGILEPAIIKKGKSLKGVK